MLHSGTFPLEIFLEYSFEALVTFLFVPYFENCMLFLK